MPVFSPLTAADAAEIIRATLEGRRKLEIRGGGTKVEIGAPRPHADILDVSRMCGVIDYTPAELVLTARAGTPIAEIQALLASNSQMLAFEPLDYSPILGSRTASTLGGVVAAAAAGSRRLSRGGVRDHLLGFRAVSGRGEAIGSGGKVVKNVTGYDLPKLMAGCWGRLGLLTEITLKVLPAPREERTLVIRGLEPPTAYRAMASAMRSQAEVAAAAHMPATAGQAVPLTLFRLEGFGASVMARCAALQAVFASGGDMEVLDPSSAQRAWRCITTVAPLADHPVLWRASIPAKAMPQLTHEIGAAGGAWLADWAGGLVWIGFDGDPQLVRRATAALGGHATLIRAPSEQREVIPTFHPHPTGVADLEERVRKAFDPADVFETRRFFR